MLKKSFFSEELQDLIDDITPAKLLCVFNKTLDDCPSAREPFEKTLLSIKDDSKVFEFIKKGICEQTLEKTPCTALKVLQKLEQIWKRVDDDTRETFNVSILVMILEPENGLSEVDNDIRSLIVSVCSMPESFNAMDYAY